MDEAVIRKAKKGDKESFTSLVLGIKDQAYRISFCYLHNEQDSLDAVCDAVEKALRNIGRLKNPSMFNTWFIRIVINECKQQMRRRSKVLHLADSLYENHSVPQQENESNMDLETQLQRMNPADRTLIYMKYYMGYTLDEIAQVMALPVGTVKTRIYSNIRSMKDQLKLKEA